MGHASHSALHESLTSSNRNEFALVSMADGHEAIAEHSGILPALVAKRRTTAREAAIGVEGFVFPMKRAFGVMSVNWAMLAVHSNDSLGALVTLNG